MKSTLCWLAFLWLMPWDSLAQRSDTLHLSLAEAEEQFVNNNLSLLAQRYNIEAARAAVLQARLLPNPNVSLHTGLVPKTAMSNGEAIKPFGERILQVQQLILLANKRNKQVDFQKVNVEMAEYQLSSLLRELSYQLKVTFYGVYYSLESLRMYDQEMLTIQKLLTAYEQQYQKGNLPYKEVVRLQSFLYGLQNEASTLRNAINESQSVLKTLLSVRSDVYIVPTSPPAVSVAVEQLPLEPLLAEALQNRPDYLYQQASVRLNKTNLTLQKSLAKPDLVVSYLYDRAGTYVNHYSGLTLGLDVPLFNRNQGNIKAAESQIKASEQLAQQAGVSLENEVSGALYRARESNRVWQSFDASFLSNYQKLIDGVVENYLKRNISLIEFTDFLESYKNSVIQLNAAQNNRMQAFEELNYAVGKRVI